MAYYVNKTDGTAILVLDGTKDTNSTSLTLFGRLVQTYGENLNENFLWLLENFALASAPDHPVTGQLWYDTSIDNLKIYDATTSTWTIVGSEIVGNVTLSGNLFIGSNQFTIRDLGNVSLINNTNNANVSFYSNIAGVSTETLKIRGDNGLLEVRANASTNFGITTKIYVDSELARIGDGANVALAANMAIVNANLAVRVNSEDDLSARINAANVQIGLRDTITRVNSINSAIDTAILANVNSINSNISDVRLEIVAANVSASGNVIAANIEIARLRSNITAANVIIASLTSDLGQTNTDITALAPKASPALTGTPTAPTPSTGTNTTRIATTAFVQTEISTIAKWQGSAKFVSTADPDSTQGSDGDFWFKYST